MRPLFVRRTRSHIHVPCAPLPQRSLLSERCLQANKDKQDKKYKEIYDIGLSFVVTPHRQVRITELAPGFESPRFCVCL